MNVKVDAELVRKAKVVAAVKNITLSKYVTELVRSHVESDLAMVALGLAGPAAVDGPPSAASRSANCRLAAGPESPDGDNGRGAVCAFSP
jgi:hypothetical protein